MRLKTILLVIPFAALAARADDIVIDHSHLSLLTTRYQYDADSTFTQTLNPDSTVNNYQYDTNVTDQSRFRLIPLHLRQHRHHHAATWQRHQLYLRQPRLHRHHPVR